jgi:hypothetical protein
VPNPADITAPYGAVEAARYPTVVPGAVAAEAEAGGQTLITGAGTRAGTSRITAAGAAGLLGGAALVAGNLYMCHQEGGDCTAEAVQIGVGTAVLTGGAYGAGALWGAVTGGGAAATGAAFVAALGSPVVVGLGLTVGTVALVERAFGPPPFTKDDVSRTVGTVTPLTPGTEGVQSAGATGTSGEPPDSAALLGAIRRQLGREGERERAATVVTDLPPSGTYTGTGTDTWTGGGPLIPVLPPIPGRDAWSPDRGDGRQTRTQPPGPSGPATPGAVTGGAGAGPTTGGPKPPVPGQTPTPGTPTVPGQKPTGLETLPPKPVKPPETKSVERSTPTPDKSTTPEKKVTSTRTALDFPPTEEEKAKLRATAIDHRTSWRNLCNKTPGMTSAAAAACWQHSEALYSKLNQWISYAPTKRDLPDIGPMLACADQWFARAVKNTKSYSSAGFTCFN